MVSMEYIIKADVDVVKLSNYILEMKRNNIPNDEYPMHIKAIAKECIVSTLNAV